MEIFLFLGYLAAVGIGVILGLIGGGGSIITVPVMVYLLGINPIAATAYSLFLVGVASTVGAIRNAQLGYIDYQTGIMFSIPAFFTVYLTRAYLIPIIPKNILIIQQFVLTKNTAVMLFFALLMVMAAVSMIRSKGQKTKRGKKVRIQLPLILLEGAGVGLVTGLVGAGGGFIIIPALVLVAGLEIKTAIGTSLFIIATKSLIGFLGDVQNSPIDWEFLLLFTSLAVAGIFIGLKYNNIMKGERLKKIIWLVHSRNGTWNNNKRNSIINLKSCKK